MKARTVSGDKKLFALVREYERFAEAQDALCGREDDPAEEERLSAWGFRVGRAIAALPATTVEGLQAKRRIVAILLEWDDTSAAERIAAAGSVSEAVRWSILNDLPGLLPSRFVLLPLADQS